MSRGHANTVVFIDGVTIRIASGLRDPSAIAGSQDRFHRGDQSAGRHRAFDAAVAVRVFVGLAIRNRK
jgi:hypothetical protein